MFHLALIASLAIAPFTTSHHELLEHHFAIQHTDASCSAASVTMVVNAMLDFQGCTTFYTEEEILATVSIPEWNKAVAQDGDGIGLDQLGHYLEMTLDAFSLPYSSVETVHVTTAGQKDEFRQLLDHVNSSTCFVIANFDIYHTLPVDYHMGHFSPLGTYNPETNCVLVMDVDRELEELEGWTNGPHWVPFDKLFSGMHTYSDESNHFRGYIILNLE